MKVIILLGLVLSLSSFARVIEEELIIKDYAQWQVKEIQKHPDLILDHMNDHHFELYGPKGTKKWLKEYLSLDSEHLISMTNKAMLAGYPRFEEFERKLRAFVAINPSIAKMFSIGKSVSGRDLWMVKISDNVEVDEIEPEFKYISSMHGNEITGRDVTLLFIKDLLQNYGTDARITELINNTEIYIMPSMNPDGSERQRRANDNNVDLNRDFPDWTRDEDNSPIGRQPETMAVMKFQKERHFALSANYHGGALVVNYPWDSSHRAHPMDELVKELSLEYSCHNEKMHKSPYFENGITNGADWYVLYGGMQDWSYFWHNDLQITIEVSSRKWPEYSRIPIFYKENRESMLSYLSLVHQGAGVKLQNINNGIVEIYNHHQESLGRYALKNGEFYKVLQKGTYRFKIEAGGRQMSMYVNVDDSIGGDNLQVIEL